MHRLAALLFLLPLTALAAPPTVRELLERYDAAMGPRAFEAQLRMTAHRDDGSSRSYGLKLLKGGDDATRVTFAEPAAVRGQELLRKGDNAWVYLPNLKRSVRLASRDSFQGGDFNNADVLRPGYARDYDGTVEEDPAHPDAWRLELRARTQEAAYDRVRLWVSRKDGLPLEGEYYAASGKLLRSAEFTDVRDFGGVRRPARVRMQNRIATKRFSELTYERFDTKARPPAGRFVLDDLGR